jgi:hypothetical protein
MNLYRIFPVLWNDGNGGNQQQAQTIYGIDRAPPSGTFPTCCCARPKEDPAYYWDNATFQRILPPPNIPGCCYQPPSTYGVNWALLPAWLSYIQQFGYVVSVDFSKLKPYSDIYITGP